MKTHGVGVSVTETNVQRFLRGLTSRPCLRFATNATRWDIQHLRDWTQLFEVAQVVVQNPRYLNLILDGGDVDVLRDLKRSLDRVATHPLTVAYRWVQPGCRKLAPTSPSEVEKWPRSRTFEVLPPKSAAFHSGLKDVVVFLPPNDLPDRNRRLLDYLEGAWVAIVYEQEPGQQEKLVGELLAHIDTRAENREHSPWLFKAGPGGKLQYVDDQLQCEVQPLPEGIRHTA